ncbi:MAG: hypothetical protein Q4E69_00460 [Bacilli bacterium]|nr:hypothetical protein [Bacilli bacterium]
MNNNTKQSFVNCTLSSDNFIYDPEKASAGVEALKTIMNNIREDYSQLLNSKLDAFYDIEAMKGTNKYKEDNLFYDISVEAMCEESGHGENFDDVIKQYPGFIADYIQRLIDKINDHIDAYEYYSGRKDFSKTVKEMMSKLKGNGDVELSLDDLTLLTREEILKKYGLTEEDLERDPNTIEFASEEEKDNYFAALQYMNNDFYNLQRLYSIGNAEDVADKLVSVESRVNHLYEETPASGGTNTSEVPIASTTNNTETSSSSNENNTSGGGTSSGHSSGGGSDEVYIGSASGSMDGITTAPKNDSSSGGSSYIPRAKTNIPENSNVESTNISEHQNEMKNATEQANNTKAFDERNEYEARIVNNEQQAQNDANKAQEAQDQADYNKKVAEQNNQSTETPTTNTETTSVEVQDAPQETVVAETQIPVQQVENVAPISTTVAQTTQAAAPQVTTAVPEIKDMISNGGTTTVAPKADASKMVSSVTSNATPLKPIKIDDAPATENTSTAGKFIPPIAGVSTAAVAGIGAKLYMNKKDDKDKEKEEKHENKFFDENIKPEEESKLNFSSKEDIIKLLDR